MVSSLVRLRGYLTREPASLICDDEQDDIFSPARATQEPALATANTGKIRERFGKNEGEWTRKVEFTRQEIPGSR